MLRGKSYPHWLAPHTQQSRCGCTPSTLLLQCASAEKGVGEGVVRQHAARKLGEVLAAAVKGGLNLGGG
jgi:hypothetical protein